MKTPSQRQGESPNLQSAIRNLQSAKGLRELLEGWDRFWFRPADPTLLGLIRLCCGLILLHVHLGYTFDLQALCGPDAWLSLDTLNWFRKEMDIYPPASGWGEETPQAVAKGQYLWSVWFHVTDPTAMAVVNGLILGILFLFTIGLGTRVMTVLAWLAVLSFMHRAPTTLFGMDAILSMVLFYLMISPAGAALSVDRLLSRYRLTRRALRGRRAVVAEGLRPAPSISANLALRLLQVHMGIIYLASGLSKLQGSSWWSGTALWGVTANYEFSPFWLAPYVYLLKVLAQHRWLWELAMTGGVVFTLAFEIGFPFLVWSRRLRWVMVASAVLLHTGIAVCMGLNTFSLIMITGVLSFVPAETVQRFLARLFRGPAPFRLAFDERNPGQARTVSLIRAFDVWDQVELADGVAVGPSSMKSGAAQPRRLQVTTPAGEARTGYALFESLVRALRLLGPVAILTWVPGVASLGKAWYPGSRTPSEPRVGEPHARPAPVADRVAR